MLCIRPQNILWNRTLNLDVVLWVCISIEASIFFEIKEQKSYKHTLNFDHYWALMELKCLSKKSLLYKVILLMYCDLQTKESYLLKMFVWFSFTPPHTHIKVCLCVRDREDRICFLSFFLLQMYFRHLIGGQTTLLVFYLHFVIGIFICNKHSQASLIRLESLIRFPSLAWNYNYEQKATKSVWCLISSFRSTMSKTYFRCYM